MDALGKLQRRVFCKALGLGLAAPLALGMARRAVAVPGARPKRLLVAFFPNGLPPEHYTPRGTRDDFDLSVGEGVLAPFAPYQRSLNVYLGLQIGGGEENHEAIAQLLLPGRERGTSVEHVVAHGMGVQAMLLGAVPMRSAGDQVSAGSKNVIFRDGDWVRTEENPIRAASLWLGQRAPASAPMPPVQGGDDASFRNQVLALTEGELEQMQRELGGLSSERSKLSVHLDAVRQLKANSAASMPASCNTTAALPFVDALRAVSHDGADKDFFFSEANIEGIYRAQLEVAASALVCGSAQVVGLQVSHGISDHVWSFVKGIGSGDQYHGTLSHGDGSKPDVRARFAKVRRWQMEAFEQHLLRALAMPDPLDAAHSVLDNTLILLCSELADGSMHNTNTKTMYLGNGQTTVSTQLPFVTLGGAGGALKSGQLLTFDNRPHTDLLASVCEAMGVPGKNFGDFTSIAELKA